MAYFTSIDEDIDQSIFCAKASESVYARNEPSIYTFLNTSKIPEKARASCYTVVTLEDNLNGDGTFSPIRPHTPRPARPTSAVITNPLSASSSPSTNGQYTPDNPRSYYFSNCLRIIPRISLSGRASKKTDATWTARRAVPGEYRFSYLECPSEVQGVGGSVWRDI